MRQIIRDQTMTAPYASEYAGDSPVNISTNVATLQHASPTAT